MLSFFFEVFFRLVFVHGHVKGDVITPATGPLRKRFACQIVTVAETSSAKPTMVIVGTLPCNTRLAKPVR